MVKKETTDVHFCCGCGSSLFWGIFFLVLGGWFLAKELGWIAASFPLWQILLILLGVWLIFKARR